MDHVNNICAPYFLSIWIRSDSGLGGRHKLSTDLPGKQKHGCHTESHQSTHIYKNWQVTGDDGNYDHSRDEELRETQRGLESDSRCGELMWKDVELNSH